MKMNLQRLEKDLGMYEEHAQMEKNTEYQTAVEHIQEVINNYDEAEAVEILDRMAWIIRRETTTFITEQQ